MPPSLLNTYAHLVVLDCGPYFFVQKCQVEAVLSLIAEILNELGHALHSAFRPAPESPIQRSLVVRVVSYGVHAFAALNPLLHGEALPRVQAAVGVAHDVPIDRGVILLFWWKLEGDVEGDQ